MDMNRKLEVVKREIAMITRADDDDIELTAAACSLVSTFISNELDAAKDRRAKKAASAAMALIESN